MNVSEVLDALRTFPRFFCLGYGALLTYVTLWYCHLAAPSAAQTGFTATVYGIAGVVLKFYLDGGYDWAQRRKDKHDRSNSRMDKTPPVGS